MSSTNRLSTEEPVSGVKALVDGNSQRATARIAGVARMTVEKLLRDLSEACTRYQDVRLRNLTSRRMHCDGIWSFTYAKQRNLTPKIAEKVPEAGDVWTWVAIDAETKLAVSWLVGDRGVKTAFAFMDDLASRLCIILA